MPTQRVRGRFADERQTGVDDELSDGRSCNARQAVGVSGQSCRRTADWRREQIGRGQGRERMPTHRVRGRFAVEPQTGADDVLPDGRLCNVREAVGVAGQFADGRQAGVGNRSDVGRDASDCQPAVSAASLPTDGKLACAKRTWVGTRTAANPPCQRTACRRTGNWRREQIGREQGRERMPTHRVRREFVPAVVCGAWLARLEGLVYILHRG